jgi:hypothetical protein
MKLLAPLALFAFAAVVHAQASTTVLLPSVSYSVLLSWTQPAVCTAAAPCTYQPYRITGACPAQPMLAQWVQTTTSAVNASSVSDTTVASGQAYCYVVLTNQQGAYSPPSNSVAVTIPSVPPQPTGITAVHVP